MTLCNLDSLLKDARAKKYAVLAIDVFNFDMAETILNAADEKKSPVIFMVCDDLFKYFNFNKLIKPIISIINDMDVRVVLHLDHCTDYNLIVKSLKAGLSSVMFDGSFLPIDENIRITKKIVDIAHILNVSVEGEVGVVGGREGGFDPKNKKVDKENFTRVEDAVRFAESTGVDALAIAVGTVHGLYNGIFKLDFERISEIFKKVEVPLVLHGGSGCSDRDFQRAVECGITKINYYTNLMVDATDRIKEIITDDKNFNNYAEINYQAMLTIKEKVKEKFDVIYSSNKY